MWVSIRSGFDWARAVTVGTAEAMPSAPRPARKLRREDDGLQQTQQEECSRALELLVFTWHFSCDCQASGNGLYCYRTGYAAASASAPQRKLKRCEPAASVLQNNGGRNDARLCRCACDIVDDASGLCRT